MLTRALQSFKHSRESSMHASTSGTAAVAGANNSLFGDFAADIYRAHVSADDYRRSTQTAVDSTSAASINGDKEGSTPPAGSDTRERRRDSWDSQTDADSSPRSHWSRSPTSASTLHGRGGTADTRSPNNPGRGSRGRQTSGHATRAGASSDSDDSDAEMAALFAAEATAGTQRTGAQGPGKTVSILDMANNDYQPSQHARGAATQHTHHMQQRYQNGASQAVSVPRSAASLSQQRSSPSAGGSSKKKIKKKKRNRKVI